VECGRHSNIVVHTLTEVEDVSGQAGNFTVRLRKHPRHVDMDKCIACGICAQKCPKKVPDEYNESLGTRKAAYIPYGQAVPLKYAVDSAHCIYHRKGKCRVCEKYCPTGAIDLTERERTEEIPVGSVILAPGFTPYNPAGRDIYAYKQFPDVVTSLEYERMLSPSGPTLGHLARPSDKTEPKRIGWLQCVGSRSNNQCANPYCSSICCMSAVKQALVTAEHVKEGVEQTVFLMDIRTFGKGFEQYFNTARDKGVRFLRTRPHTVYPGDGGRGVRVEYLDEKGREQIQELDLLVLSIGLESPTSARELAGRLGVELDPFGFVRSSDLDPVSTSREGIFACGCFTGPKDIPGSVIEASAAASAAASTLTGARGSLARQKPVPPARDVLGEPPRIGVFVCSCGINIAGVIDVRAVAEAAKALPHVVHVDNSLFSCSQDAQSRLGRLIHEHRLNRIVVAACTPRTHEPLFRESLEAAGLNKYLLEMANIRNQGSWVHASDPKAATARAMDQVRMAVAKVSQLSPLDEPRLSVTSAALVVGAGLAGMRAALELAGQGVPVHLVEKAPELGGTARVLRATARGQDIQEALTESIRSVTTNPLITVHAGTTIRGIDGFVGSFRTTLSSGRTLEHGAVIVATGARESRPTEYAYSAHPGVLTHLELDAAIGEGRIDPSNPSSVVFIQCVGSREPQRPYCSKVCCTHAVKSALLFKKANPTSQVYVLYRDMRTYGTRELLYEEARAKGVLFIRFGLSNKPVVTPRGDQLEVVVRDHILDLDLSIDADHVVLAAAIVPAANQELSRMLKLPLDNDGWFLEAHQKLRPVDSPVDGVFLAGLAHYPKPVEESVSMAQAAASRAMAVLSRQEITLPGTVASIEHDKCTGCGVCWAVCPYVAISPDQAGLASVNPSLCKGCGLCVAACRSGAPNLKGYTSQDIMAQIGALDWDEREEPLEEHAVSRGDSTEER
jgi:heterodisulfide reductase subunit A2